MGPSCLSGSKMNGEENIRKDRRRENKSNGEDSI